VNYATLSIGFLWHPIDALQWDYNVWLNFAARLSLF